MPAETRERSLSYQCSSLASERMAKELALLVGEYFFTFDDHIFRSFDVDLAAAFKINVLAADGSGA